MKSQDPAADVVSSAGISGEKVSAENLKGHRLRNDRIELTLLPQYGCHWKSLRLSAKGKWLELLQEAEEDESTGALRFGSYVLAPWSNRIADGRFDFNGDSYELRKNSADGTAIHGDVRSRHWEVLEATGVRFEAALDSRTVDGFNYPFDLVFRHAIELCAETVKVDFAVRNVDSRPAPVGFGFHPFLKRRLSAADRDVILQVPAERVYPAVGCLPTAPAEEVEGPLDLRRLEVLGGSKLDHCYTAIADAPIRLIYPGTRVEVRLRMAPVFSHVVVYTPHDSSGSPLDSVAVEPVTHANNGFNLESQGWSDTGVQSLEPGEEVVGHWELSAGDI